MQRYEYSSLRQGLVGAWCPSLGATGLSLIDRSGLNNHGTLTNMGGQSNWRASGSGLALNFDGVDDYVATNVVLNGPYTVSIWANRRTAGSFSERVVWGNTANFNTYIANITATSVVVQSDNSNTFKIFAGFTFVNNAWFHVVVSRDSGNNVRVWKDGVESSSGAQAISPVFNLNALGRYADASGGNAPYQWDGFIDDVRVYTRAVTLAEIRLLASRRGIGLTPLPDRAAGLPRKFRVKVGGVHEQADAYVRVAGVWRLAEAKANDAGVWK